MQQYFSNRSQNNKGITALAKPGVLVISNLFSVGTAYGSVSKELAIRLSRSGWQVTTTSALRKRLMRPLDMIWTVWRTRHHYDVALIDVFSGPAFRWAEAAALALGILGKPVILTLHGGNLPAYAVNHPDRVHRLLNSAACVTTPSRYLLEAMTDYALTIRLIPNPIDVDAYTFRLRSSPTPQLLYLRALHSTYNPLMAVYAFNELLQHHSDARLTMVGPDKGDGTAEQLRKTIRSLDLSSVVSLLGAVPKEEVPNLMKLSDIFINTTNIDNTPISVIEAMASGLCIVSTAVGGIPYLLEDGRDALLVTKGDSHGMAMAVRRILDQPELAERLSQNAREKVERFDWSAVLPKWERLIAAVAKYY